MTFTQCPWHVQFLSESKKLPYMVFDDNIAAIARVHSEKDARLISIAPEMHALLARVASDDLGDVQTAVELAMDARELLAKVEGEK